jgi:hypothetical protein
MTSIIKVSNYLHMQNSTVTIPLRFDYISSFDIADESILLKPLFLLVSLISWDSGCLPYFPRVLLYLFFFHTETLSSVFVLSPFPTSLTYKESKMFVIIYNFYICVQVFGTFSWFHFFPFPTFPFLSFFCHFYSLPSFLLFFSFL